jgi:hypothetical protein
VVMEMQSTELRFLIGNVAHDLKTPLQAFSYELEVLKKSPAMSSSASGKESLMLLESVCSFMLMTINRAIDYTKVTSGIKLKPSLATVDVKGVFEWVKKCVTHTDSTNRSVPISGGTFFAGNLSVHHHGRAVVDGELVVFDIKRPEVHGTRQHCREVLIVYRRK